MMKEKRLEMYSCPMRMNKDSKKNISPASIPTLLIRNHTSKSNRIMYLLLSQLMMG